MRRGRPPDLFLRHFAMYTRIHTKAAPRRMRFAQKNYAAWQPPPHLSVRHRWCALLLCYAPALYVWQRSGCAQKRLGCSNVREVTSARTVELMMMMMAHSGRWGPYQLSFELQKRPALGIIGGVEMCWLCPMPTYYTDRSSITEQI